MFIRFSTACLELHPSLQEMEMSLASPSRRETVYIGHYGVYHWTMPAGPLKTLLSHMPGVDL